MTSENHPAPILDKVNQAAVTSPIRPQTNQKNPKKVPKKIHKAEREKMKRDNLNKLFLALADSLEESEQTNGKACVLTEATRFIKDMVSQLESLREDNVALLSESNYVTSETNELKDETTTLMAHIAKLKDELKERVAESAIDLNEAPPECQQHELAPQYMDDHFRYPVTEPPFQQVENMHAVYVIPMSSNPGVLMNPGTAQDSSMPSSAVSKPHPRYPNPSDIWSSQLLEKHP